MVKSTRPSRKTNKQIIKIIGGYNKWKIKNLEAIMGLIMFGGNAKSDAMEAIAAAKKVISL